MDVKKRDGRLVPFEVQRIVSAISKAMIAVNKEKGISPCLPHIERIARDVAYDVTAVMRCKNKIWTVEEIQTLVENKLMEAHMYDVARAFICYRKEHKEDRDTAEKLRFLIDYCNSSNAATGSKYDANANVDNKNIATLIGELPKANFIRLNRRLLTDRIKMMYGDKLADRYIDLLTHHFIYKNDETSMANYCASITMYPWLIGGTFSIGGNSTAPTNLKSFCGGFVNMVFIVSSMLSGACATPEFLMYMNYFIGKEYGKDYWKRANETADLSLKRRTIDKVITDCFEQVVYSINQPTGARNFQAVFWNIAYYDKYYFESLFGDFVFPDDSKPDWDGLNWLQKRFMKWFNKERTKTILTFPVETMALLSENGDVKDKEYGDFTAEMYAEGHSFFTYLSDNADSLSSCCYSKDTKVIVKDARGAYILSFEDVKKKKFDSNGYRIFNNGKWSKGNLVELSNRPMYKIVTANNKEMYVTDNHRNNCLRGTVLTSDLTTNDYIMLNSTPIETYSSKDEGLTYEMGVIVGAFLGDGSMGSERHLACGEDKIYDVSFSLSKNKMWLCDIIDRGLEQMGISTRTTLGEIRGELYPVRVCSNKLVEFLKKHTNWERGIHALTKSINMDCLLQSIDFREGIMDGWYATDGNMNSVKTGASLRGYSTSKELIEDMDAIATSLGYITSISVDNRKEKPIFHGIEANTTHDVYCLLRYKKNCQAKIAKDCMLFQDNSYYVRIKSIEKVEYTGNVFCFEMEDKQDDKFTLANGIHNFNCRLRNEIQDNGFSYTLGAGGVSTGSKSVLTINLNRCIQYAVKKNIDYKEFLSDIIDLTHKAQLAYNENLKELQKKGMLPLFDAGYININRQYLTIGVNGLVEAAEFMGLKISNNPQYLEFVQTVLGLVEKYNKQYRTKETMFNCEMIPAENVGVKHAKWDKEDGYFVPRDCYNSYFYVVEDPNTSVLEKFKLHGAPYIEHLTGGSALHMNLEEHLSQPQYRQLLRIAAKEGCNYFTFNIPNTYCKDCGHIDKRYLKECPHCHSKNVDYLTRIIGYLKRVSSFSEPRQVEAARRFYGKLKSEDNA